MRSLAVACVLASATAAAAPAIYEDVPIRSITWSDFDSGGSPSSIDVYATGYARVQGKVARYAPGWYRVRDVKALQATFDAAAASAAYPVSAKVVNTVTLTSGANINASVRFADDLDLEPASAPPTAAKTIVVGHRIASVPVRDALHFRDPARAGRLGREDAATFVVVVDIKQDPNFLVASLTAIGANHIDLLPPLLGDRTAAPPVIAALGANGEKARPYTKAIAAAARSSFQALEAAAPALAAIGGKDAELALGETIIPKLADGGFASPRNGRTDPRERVTYQMLALPILDKLGTPDAKRAVATIVVPALVAFTKDEIGKPVQSQVVAQIGAISAALAARKLLSIDLAVLVEGYLVKAMGDSDAETRLHAVIGAQNIYTDGAFPPRLRSTVETLAKDRVERVAQAARALLDKRRQKTP